MAQMLDRSGADASAGPLKAEVIDQVLAELERGFDPRDGGFRGAPKFPPSLQLQFLLRLRVWCVHQSGVIKVIRDGGRDAQ